MIDALLASSSQAGFLKLSVLMQAMALNNLSTGVTGM